MVKYHKGIQVEGSDEFLLAVNITGAGAPTEKTEAEPGMCYLDTNSATGDLYKCIGVLVTEAGTVYRWKKLADQEEVDRLSKAIEELEQNSGANVELDTTLSVEGKAADAAAVGIALSGKVTGSGITAIMAITQADYDQLVMLGTVDESTLYIIRDTTGNEDTPTMIPVLRSDGVAWIDLGIAAPAGAWYEVCFRGISDMDLYDAIFGNKHTYICSAGGKLTNTWMAGYYAGSKYATFGSDTIDLGTKHTYKMTSTALILDGDTENATAITAGTVAYTNPLYLFACNKYSGNDDRTDSVSGNSAIDFFYLRIWSSEDKLLHNYIPAQDESGVACVYDTVAKAYLYNVAESGEFEYREELEES